MRRQVIAAIAAVSIAAAAGVGLAAQEDADVAAMEEAEPFVAPEGSADAGDWYNQEDYSYDDEGDWYSSDPYQDSSTAGFDELYAQAEARAAVIRASGAGTFEVPPDGIFDCIAPWDYTTDWTEADFEDYAQCLAAM